jgi:hypothetical protein
LLRRPRVAEALAEAQVVLPRLPARREGKVGTVNRTFWFIQISTFLPDLISWF